MRSSVITVFALMAANCAQAATISVQPRDGGRPALVLVEGDLELNDGEQFRTKTSFLSKAIIILRSDGGNVVAGIQIGESIRLKAFTTYVPEDARCASACALAWLGGIPRFMAARAQIGFHAAYNEKSGQETGWGNALVGAYLNKIGLPYSAVRYITETPPDSIKWLSISDAEKHGIDVTLVNPASTMPPASTELSTAIPQGTPLTAPPQASPSGGGGVPPCMAEFAKLREDVQKKGLAAKAAGERKVSREEMCKHITAFNVAELKWVKFTESNVSSCGISAQVVQQIKQVHDRTEQTREKICAVGPAAGDAPR